MIKIFVSKDWPSNSAGKQDYELLDTGDGEKLERFGPYTFVRPHEDAVWSKTLTKEVQKTWEQADGKFWSSKKGTKPGTRLASASNASRGGWKMESKIKEKWEMEYKGIKFLAMPTPFRHLGFFPEQASHWDFIETRLRQGSGEARKIKFLNLFGYTGVASLFALRAGAEVTHVDASKTSLAWAKENQEISGLGNLPMRVIEDDVIKFLEREVKRGNTYDAIIMDPPKFGRGPKGETWKFEEMLPKLLTLSKKVLSERPLFVILTSYATDSSSLTLGYALESTMGNLGGTVESGELCVLEKSNSRTITLANTAVWSIIDR